MKKTLESKVSNTKNKIKLIRLNLKIDGVVNLECLKSNKNQNFFVENLGINSIHFNSKIRH